MRDAKNLKEELQGLVDQIRAKIERGMPSMGDVESECQRLCLLNRLLAFEHYVDGIVDQDVFSPQEIVKNALDSLTDSAKSWLHLACENAAENEGIRWWNPEVEQCAKLGLITIGKNRTIEIPPDVMEAVYSQQYLADKGAPSKRG